MKAKKISNRTFWLNFHYFKSNYKNNWCKLFYFIFLRFYFFIFREGKGKRKRGKYQCVVASHMPPTGDLACNPGMCPRLGIEPSTFDSKAGTQPLSYTSQELCSVVDSGEFVVILLFRVMIFFFLDKSLQHFIQWGLGDDELL